MNGASTAAFRLSTAQSAPGIFNTPDVRTGRDGVIGSGGRVRRGEHADQISLPEPPPASLLLAFAFNSDGPTPVFIGGIACDVLFAGLSSSQVGVNQLSVVVPTEVHGIVPLQINAGGIVTSPAVMIVIQ